MSLRRRLNPRLHIAAAIGWAVFGVVTMAALVAAMLAADQAEQRARVDAEGQLAEIATQLRDAVSMRLETRRWLLQATAAQISAAVDRRPDALRRVLQAAKAQFPEFVWLGVADASGHLVAETGDEIQGVDVSSMAWFQHGSRQPFVSDLHAALPGERSATAAVDKAPPLIDAATPLRGGGVLVAYLSWLWFDEQVSRMRTALNRNAPVELMIVAHDGKVLVGPDHWVGKTLAVDKDAAEGERYVIGARARLRLADSMGLGWTAIVRQRADLALAPVRTTRRTVFLIVFAAGLLSAGAALLVTRLLTRRLGWLAADAEAVRRGERGLLTVPAGKDEVGRIGATLAQLVDHLQTEKNALQRLNVELDERVAERTRRIEHLAEDARRAAVTRERLRIARDLHDTLAHSLMALLTQVRLIRKLGARLEASELDAELQRAEEVATTGLSEARAAITQMRDNGVRETGLGPALQDLAGRFTERTGSAVDLSLDEVASKWTDERAETLFRIIEEALRNVERHAAARFVRIELGARRAESAPNVVGIEVIDDGVGFDTGAARQGHFGLRGMQEQAELLGAALTIESSQGRGTRIAMVMPV